MAHFTRIQADATYVHGSPLPNTWWNTIDANQTAALNGGSGAHGDGGGGTWAPSAAIIITPNGLTASQWSGYTTNFQTLPLWVGGVWTAGAGSSITSQGPGGQIVHGDNDYIGLFAPGSRLLLSDFGRFVDFSPTGVRPALFDQSGGSGGCNVQSPSNVVQIPLAVHHNATFTQIVLTVSLNTTTLLLRVIKVALDGTVSSLRTGAPTTSGGWLAYTTPALTFTLSLDPNVVIDTSKFYYALEVTSSSATNCNLLSVVSTFTNIPDIRPQ